MEMARQAQLPFMETVSGNCLSVAKQLKALCHALDTTQ
jgi:hypothetical protein